MEAWAPSFSVKIMQGKDIRVLNVCDADLLGKVLRDGVLEVGVSEAYFGGERVDATQALRLVKSFATVNLVGDRIVNEVIKAKLASPGAVKKFSKVSFLMIFKFG